MRQVSQCLSFSSPRAMVEELTDLSKLTSQVLSDLRLEAEKSLFFFAKGILGFTKLDKKIHGPICRILESPELRRRGKIVLPRSWYKSTLISIAYPLWRAMKNPNIRILLAQNTYINATSKLRTIGDMILTNQILRALWPEVLPDKSCVWKAEKMELKRTQQWPEATFEAAGIKTQIVSRHYDLIIEDDTVAPDLSDIGEDNIAPTKEDIDQAIGWHRLVPPLLTSMQEGEILVVGTRWFEKDLLSWIAENEKYTTYERAVRENQEGLPTEDGELTFPEQFPEPILDELKAALGPYMFSCLYLNKPLRTGDMIFNLEWFKYYEELPRDIVHYTSVDPAGDPEDTKGEPDFNIVATCAKDLVTGRIYLVDYFRAKCSPGDLIDAFFRHVELYKPVKAAIEAVAYQKSLLYHIREGMKNRRVYTIIEPITHGRKSKNARIMGLQPLLSSGMLSIKNHHREFVKEALAFPLGKNDDLIDCVSMQLPIWNLTRTRREIRNSKLDDPNSLESIEQSIRDMHKNKDSKYPNLRLKQIKLPSGVLVRA